MWLLSYKIFGPYTFLIHELSDLEQKRFGQKMLKKVSFCPSLSANNLETTLNLILKIYVRLNKVDIILQVHGCRFSSFRDKKKSILSNLECIQLLRYMELNLQTCREVKSFEVILTSKIDFNRSLSVSIFLTF